MELSSNCLAQQAQYEAMGDYQKVCVQNDATQVYIHIDPTINMYLYYQTEIQVCCFKKLIWDLISKFLMQKWLFSSYVGDAIANIGICSVQSCPTDHEQLDTQWYFYNGTVNIKHKT